MTKMFTQDEVFDLAADVFARMEMFCKEIDDGFGRPIVITKLKAMHTHLFHVRIAIVELNEIAA